jgi:CRP/FNR family transcriptional regulator
MAEQAKRVLSQLSQFPALAALPPKLAQEVEAQIQPMAVSAGTTLFDAGMTCQALPLILQGRIKVSKRAESGREIRLYDVHPGELCIVTVGCLLGRAHYVATGIAETSLQAVALPRPLFMRLLDEHPPFRAWVFELFTERISGLMQLVEEVAFRKLDQRLATWLAEHAPLVEASHQAIADQLGSVREIISRLLRQFEEQGLVRLGRERIDVLDSARLKRLMD